MQFDFKKPNIEKAKDSGLALVLICLLCYQIWKQSILLLLAILFLLIAMSCPRFFSPFAVVWFTLSSFLGSVMSKVILTLLFFMLVLPIGLARRVMGKDAMRTKGWKKGKDSVFRVRNHSFQAKDLEHPY